MKITIFAKKRTNADGKVFYTYLGRMTKKDGTYQSVQVKFKDGVSIPKPDRCPMIIEFNKTDANLSQYTYDNKQTGATGTGYNLWVSNWREGEEFIDHSLDDYE